MIKNKKYQKNQYIFVFLSLAFMVFLLTLIISNTINSRNTLKTEAAFKQKNNASNKLVIDGLPTKRGDWPFIVTLFDIENFKLKNPYHRGSISYQENISDGLDMSTYNNCSNNLASCPSNIYYRFFCAGSLISNEWILTAEHCVYDIKKNKKNLGIAIGLYDLKHDNIDRKNRYVIEVSHEDIIIHDDLCSVGVSGQITCVNDLALIRIKNPINIGKTISLSNQDDFFANKNSLFLGWGFNSSINVQKINEKNYVFTNRPYILLRSDQFITNTTNLSNKYNQYYKNKNIIEIGNNTTSLCLGDSGGPMISYDENTGKYYLTGINSFVTGIDQPDSTDQSKYTSTCTQPSYMVNVSNYLKWIMEKTKIKTGFLKSEHSIKFDNGTFIGNPLNN